MEADFLETWLSNVEYSRRYAEFHHWSRPGENVFAYVGARQSLTGANADRRIFTRPEGVHQVALALLHLAVAQGATLGLSPESRKKLKTDLAPYGPRSRGGAYRRFHPPYHRPG